MADQKRILAAKVEEIQARLEAIQATEVKNEFHFDDSALARAKQAVADLETRLAVKARIAEMDGRFSNSGTPTLDPDRDPAKEFDAEFGHQGHRQGLRLEDRRQEP